MEEKISADWPAAILALDGELNRSGPKGERQITAEEFFLGAMTTAIELANRDFDGDPRAGVVVALRKRLSQDG